MIYDLQKASVLKRISAFLLDFILVCILAVGFAFLVSWVIGYDAQYNRIQALDEKCVADYELSKYLPEPEEGGKYTMQITKEEYDGMSAEGKAAYNAASEAYKAEAGRTRYADDVYLFSLFFVMVSLGLFFATLILEFVVPLLLKNGKTVGKKIFNIGVMQINGVKIGGVALFVRAMLGKYAIETMVPVALGLMFFFINPNLILLIVIAAVFVLQLVLIIATKNNSLIHDVLSSTVVVDTATQMIFDSYDALLAYKEEVHAQQVEQQKY